MEIRQLNYFVGLAEEGNYLNAAEELFVSQSQLSKKIMLMEEELGIKLVDRSKRKIAITDAGKVVLDYAEDILVAYNSMLRELEALRKGPAPVLNLVSLPVLAPYNIPALLAKFRAANPGVEINLSEAEGRTIVPEMLRGNFEMGLLRDIYLDPAALCFIPVCEDEVTLVVSASHRLASSGPVDLASLRGERFILPDQQTLLHQYYLDLCLREGFSPDVAYISSHTEEILEMVASNMGISLMMRTVVEYNRKDTVRCVSLSHPAVSRIGFAWPRNARLSVSAARFAEFLRGLWENASER